jgi:hypothetical protein
MSGAQYDDGFGDGFNGAPAAPVALVQPRHAGPGQATQVEQARAIAEVRAAVMIAMDRPRDRSAAINEMREVCGFQALADRAFFRVPRGGEQVNGESIHLARELARCWGNIDYGVKELNRDDVRGQSELLAFAWDLQTNARSEVTFVVPHVKGKNNRRLTGTQEIYENNASFAGRRLREVIFAVLPVWFKAEAADICHKTLESGGGKPLPQRIADTRAAFEAIGIRVSQLEKKRGRKIDDFLPEDLGALRVVFGSIKRGEATMAEEFPTDEISGTALPSSVPSLSKLDALERSVTAKPPSAPAVVEQPTASPQEQAQDDAASVLAALATCKIARDVASMQADYADEMKRIAVFPAILKQVEGQIEVKRQALLTGPTKVEA